MMRTRNTLLIMVALGLMTLGATSCGTAMNLARINAAAYTDDLYGIHDTEALREAERLLAEQIAAEKAAQEKRIAAMIAAANAEADIDDLLSDVDVVASPAGTVVSSNTGGDVNVYTNIYVDDYQSAYARRLQGFTSLTYRMPSSYWDYRYGDAYFLTLAYDPAFYTVMIMGDQVWVEPRYITNMFGSWNNPYYYGYHYGYNPYYFGYSYGYWDYWGWNSPYWGCDPFYHHHCHNHWYGPHYGHPHNPPHPPVAGGHKRPNVSHRPSYGVTAGGSTSRPSYREQFGGVSTSRGGTQIAGGTSGSATSSRGGSSARPAVSNGRVPENVGTTRSEMAKPTHKNELSGTLSGTTINPNASRPTRGGGVSGVSNSSSRSSRSAVTSNGGSSSSSRSAGVSSKSSSSSSRSSSSRVSSGSSSRSSRSSSVSSSSSSRSSSSSSSRSSYSSSGSSSRSSYSSGGSSSSSSRSSGSSRSSRR
ncbi:MAG: hypothetical protein IJZ09_03845 [Tidjanibacter sp.]|nr:hypothetical protein [Tidjanibacter sp.]